MAELLNLTKNEIRKLKRYRITVVGILSVILTIIISSIQINAMTDGNINFGNLVSMVIWNSSTIFYPFSISLIGGYLINREYIEDTKKNILLIPISWDQIIKVKIIVIFMLNLLFAFTECLLVTVGGVVLNSKGINLSSIISAYGSIIIMQISMIIGLFPIILLFSYRQGRYVWGSFLAMMLGVIGIFISNGKIVNFHPITLGFSFISFGMVNQIELNIRIAISSLLFYILVSVIIFYWRFIKEK